MIRFTIGAAAVVYLKRIPDWKTASFSLRQSALLMMYPEPGISIAGYVFADHHKAQ